ncbi:TPA: isopenicillin N synthase family oxygenase [Klebsiella pneumoniae]|nr:isopenicillin N synthase family oxygenase [Klebsiella pneumoniae]
MNATTLPILDLARYADPADKAAFLADLRHAARDIGFFYLINHGVDDALQYEVQRQSQRFFALDEAQKQQVAMIHSPHFRGYNRVASELTRGQPDWREQFDIGAERPALTLSDDAPRWQRLSIAFFLGAQLDAVVPVYTLPPELAREARGPDSDPHNPLLRDVGWNYLKGRLRSHPDVAERYYQDVFRERAEQLIV